MNTLQRPRPVIHVLDEDRVTLEEVTFAAKRRWVVRSHANAAELAAGCAGEPGCLVMSLIAPDIGQAERRARYSLLDGRRAIILVGSHATVGMIVRLFKLGVVDFLRKPLDRLHLSRAVLAALRRDRELQAARAAQERLVPLPRLAQPETCATQRPGTRRAPQPRRAAQRPRHPFPLP